MRAPRTVALAQRQPRPGVIRLGRTAARILRASDRRAAPTRQGQPRQRAATPSGATFEDLIAVVTRLRDPGGCPWDREQTHISLRQYLLEETYETLEAIESGDSRKLAEELGDLLTHIAFHADMARRAGEFTEEELFSGVIAKLVRRHPHVFGRGPKLGTSKEVLGQWEDLKRKEGGRDSIADGVPAAMPALAFAAALQRRAAKAGLTWDGEDAFRTRKGESSAAKEARAGAYLWSVVRRLQDEDVDPETALRAASLKFRDRIRQTEKLAGGKPLARLWRVPDAQRQRLWEKVEDR